MPKPRVTIVTPSYNMAEFLEQTIQSVLSQDYSDIEYIVMDACSTDGTREVLKRYEGRLRYSSAPDLGPADAINQGFAQGSGEILAWLNADDTYLPGAIATGVAALESDPVLSAIYGEAWMVDISGKPICRYPTQSPEHLSQECSICQPSCFMRRSAFEAAGRLDQRLQLAFDYDLWMRMPGKWLYIENYLATSRMHVGNRSLSNRKAVYKESIQALNRHYGYVPFQWIYGNACYLVDRRDQFYDPIRPSILKFALSMPMGFWQNRRQVRRYWKECRKVMTREGFNRRWNESWLGRVVRLGAR